MLWACWALSYTVHPYCKSLSMLFGSCHQCLSRHRYCRARGCSESHQFGAHAIPRSCWKSHCLVWMQRPEKCHGGCGAVVQLFSGICRLNDHHGFASLLCNLHFWHCIGLSCILKLGGKGLLAIMSTSLLVFLPFSDSQSHALCQAFIRRTSATAAGSLLKVLCLPFKS